MLENGDKLKTALEKIRISNNLSSVSLVVLDDRKHDSTSSSSVSIPDTTADAASHLTDSLLNNNNLTIEEYIFRHSRQEVVFLYKSIPHTSLDFVLISKPLASPFRRSQPPTQSQLRLLSSYITENHLRDKIALLQFRKSLVPFVTTLDTTPHQKPLELLLEALGCHIGTLWQYHEPLDDQQPAMLTLVAVAGKHHHENYTRTCLPEGEGLVWIALKPQASGIEYIENPSPDELANKETYADYKGQRLALVKLELNGHLQGVLCLVGVGRDLTAHKVEILRLFQDFCTLILQRVVANRRQTILKKLPELLPEGQLSIQHTSQLVVNSVRELVSARGASIFLRRDLDPKQSCLQLAAVALAPHATASEATKLFISGHRAPSYDLSTTSVTQQIVMQRKAIVCNDITAHKQTGHIYLEIEATNAPSWIGVPLLDTNDNVIGVLRCMGKTTEISNKTTDYIFDQYDLLLLQYVSSIFRKFMETFKAFNDLEKLSERLALGEKIRAHETAAPLASISANASFVARHLNDSGVTSKGRRLQEIISDADICAFLLREIRVPPPAEFAKGLSYGSVAQLLRQVRSFLQRQIASREGLRVIDRGPAKELDYLTQHFMKIELCGTATYTLLHRWLLQRAFYNLGVNAVKYGRNNGTLSINLAEDQNGNIVIQFSDDGLGIPEGEEALIFDEGGRGSNITDFPGEGLGLFLARQIVTAHGGSLELTHRENPTTFECRIPVRAADDASVDIETHPSVVRFDKPIPSKRV